MTKLQPMKNSKSFRLENETKQSRKAEKKARKLKIKQARSEKELELV